MIRAVWYCGPVAHCFYSRHVLSFIPLQWKQISVKYESKYASYLPLTESPSIYHMNIPFSVTNLSSKYMPMTWCHKEPKHRQIWYKGLGLFSSRFPNRCVFVCACSYANVFFLTWRKIRKIHNPIEWAWMISHIFDELNCNKQKQTE